MYSLLYKYIHFVRKTRGYPDDNFRKKTQEKIHGCTGLLDPSMLVFPPQIIVTFGFVTNARPLMQIGSGFGGIKALK